MVQPGEISKWKYDIFTLWRAILKKKAVLNRFRSASPTFLAPSAQLNDSDHDALGLEASVGFYRHKKRATASPWPSLQELKFYRSGQEGIADQPSTSPG